LIQCNGQLIKVQTTSEGNIVHTSVSGGTTEGTRGTRVVLYVTRSVKKIFGVRKREFGRINGRWAQGRVGASTERRVGASTLHQPQGYRYYKFAMQSIYPSAFGRFYKLRSPEGQSDMCIAEDEGN
jgi:hypothetical protein